MSNHEKQPQQETPEEWEDYWNEIHNLFDSLSQHESVLEIADRIAEFRKKLMEKFGQERVRTYIGFEIINGSTTNYTKSPNIDFESPYSVKTFLENLVDEYGIRNSENLEKE